MKKLIASLIVLASAQSANALHVYASYDCSNEKLQFAYDGPGSNYAVGGASNIYLKSDVHRKDGMMSYENMDGENSQVGEGFGDGKLEIIFSSVNFEQVGEEKTIPVDKKNCVGYEYEETTYKSVQTIKIDQISALAAAKLGLKAGQVLKFSCDHTSSVPEKCDNDEE